MSVSQTTTTRNNERTEEAKTFRVVRHIIDSFSYSEKAWCGLTRDAAMELLSYLSDDCNDDEYFDLVEETQ